MTRCQDSNFGGKCIYNYILSVIVVKVPTDTETSPWTQTIVSALVGHRLTTMGGAVGMDSIAVAVPLMSEVRQDLVLPYHVLVKTLKYVCDLLLLI